MAGRGRTTRRRTATAGIDMQRIGRGLASPGMDPRPWVVSATVGIVDDNGQFSTVAPAGGPRSSEAVAVERNGAIVSVRIESTGEVVNVRYNGIAVGRFGAMLVPLRPGDEVLVAFPDGNIRHAGSAIVALQSNQTARLPADWANERVLFVLNVPFEIRAPTINLTAAGGVTINGRSVGPGPEGI